MNAQAQLIEGKPIAAKVQAEVEARVRELVARYGRPPGLDVVLVGEDPASQVYVRNKERASTKIGMRGAVHRLPADTSEAALTELVQRLNADDAVDGILVQMPLPKHIDAERVIGLMA
jgi:methylenetetrahydrofolate dehydrogenase (NADP+) / methenyltetrahydrofolate cyclohydrolase